MPGKSGKKKPRPFVGCDGEGAGVDRNGRQHYMLFRIGDRELYTGKPLKPAEIFDFILAEPERSMLVCFALGYDATQTLRQLPTDRLRNGYTDADTGEIIAGTGIFDPPPIQGLTSTTWWEGYGIEYVPNNLLRVCRLDKRNRRIEHSGRTIWDIYGLFRRSFLDTLKASDVGREHWVELARMKAARPAFDRITREIRDYCALECDLLAQLMEQFRERAHAVGLHPSAWAGAGRLASFLHNKHGTPRWNYAQAGSYDYANKDMGPYNAALRAFYGGRFEAVRFGEIAGPIYEYDLNSAYPAALRDLPCMTIGHGRYVKAEPLELAEAARRGDLFLADVTFQHPPGATVCGLPMRREDGRIYWPLAGKGTYWSCELRAAQKLGASIMLEGGYIYQRRCDCHTFDWVAELYRQRKALGDMQGEPIKLAMAALYGKFMQRRYGTGTYYNPIWGSLVTARTRAAMVEAVVGNADSVVMFATDAVYTTKPLAVDFGDGLGQWKQQTHADLFIVQPGLYWSKERHRTRGVSGSVFAPWVSKFEKHWKMYSLLGIGTDLPTPIVYIPIRLFTGLRAAVMSGKPALAGRWAIENDGKGRGIPFNWEGKRGEHWWEGNAIVTAPLGGATDLQSADYDPAQAEDLDESRAMLDEQQDHLDLSPP